MYNEKSHREGSSHSRLDICVQTAPAWPVKSCATLDIAARTLTLLKASDSDIEDSRSNFRAVGIGAAVANARKG